MRKITGKLCAGFLSAAMAAAVCGSVSAQEAAAGAGMETHKIGVLVYSITDEEVITFRTYLQDYIGACFPDVEFLYSDSITSAEEEMEFIRNVSDAGAEGILSFNSYDLAAEVELCAENEVYYMMASGSVSDEAFASVEDNAYFLGVVGPGSEIEYQAGADMARFFADQHAGDEYFILSGGAPLGNEMHRARTEGILDALQEAYGVNFDRTAEELAVSGEIGHAAAGDLTVCICPGYLDFEEFLEPAREEYGKDRYPVVLSVLPVSEMYNTVKGAQLGLIDCYNERNLQLYNEGNLSYLTGKYCSIIGPSFAAMYNAVTGFAEDFREDGKAFRLTQGFWTSDSAQDYVEKYSLASSIAINAYNYEDLQNVCRLYNPDATLGQLQELALSYTFEDAKERRGL